MSEPYSKFRFMDGTTEPMDHGRWEVEAFLERESKRAAWKREYGMTDEQCDALEASIARIFAAKEDR